MRTAHMNRKENRPIINKQREHHARPGKVNRAPGRVVAEAEGAGRNKLFIAASGSISRIFPIFVIFVENAELIP